MASPFTAGDGILARPLEFRKAYGVQRVTEPMNHDPLGSLVRRLEGAQAAQNKAILNVLHGARCLELKGCSANAFGLGHALNQAVTLGFEGALAEGDLDRIEALLGEGGNPVVLEATPAADPSLFALLARRGYRIRTFQQVLARTVGLAAHVQVDWDPRLRVELAEPEQGDLWARVVMAGFQDVDVLEEPPDPFCLATTASGGNMAFLAWMGAEPAGGGVLGTFGGVAVLSGTSVRPRFRGLGAQRALIAARLLWASKQGCIEACAAVLPASPSQANLERRGFRVAYPKLEMVLEPGA